MTKAPLNTLGKNRDIRDQSRVVIALLKKGNSLLQFRQTVLQPRLVLFGNRIESLRSLNPGLSKRGPGNRQDENYSKRSKKHARLRSVESRFLTEAA